jgi:5-(carboxyamino)imidazole ribonucleotide synthase
VTKAGAAAAGSVGWPERSIGIVGGGQLGRLLAIEARRLGIRTSVLDPDPACPAGQVADELVLGDYGDRAAAERLASQVDVITYEFEHIDATVIDHLETLRPVRPSSRVLKVAQHRVEEKQVLERLGIPIAPFRSVESPEELMQAIIELGLPAVLKTATAGYDGRGQVVLSHAADAGRAYEMLHGKSEKLVLEKHIPFEKELSVICARDVNGVVVCYPVSENVHRNGILDTSVSPARIDETLAASAHELAKVIATELDVIGLLCVEMFLTADKRLLVNELAPRPHNSGHHTLEACPSSQFEQLLRVLCGLPLGSTELLSPTVMVNLLGDVWLEAGGCPNFAGALGVPGVKVYLYGKHDVRAGRKMGHMTALAPTLDLAEERATTARRALTHA